MTHDISFCFFLGSYFHPGLNAPKKSLNHAVLHTSTSCLLCTTLFRVFENHRKYLIVKYLDFQAKNTNISSVSAILHNNRAVYFMKNFSYIFHPFQNSVNK